METGCLYSEATITLDAQVSSRWTLVRPKYGPVEPKIPLTEKQETEFLQENLKVLGYYAGEIDGVLGPQTKAAIERYKQVKGLPKQGISSISMSASQSLKSAMMLVSGGPRLFPTLSVRFLTQLKSPTRHQHWTWD